MLQLFDVKTVILSYYYNSR